MNKKLYPIGTICVLKNSGLVVMVMGFYPLVTKTKATQYIGCKYPYGFMKSSETIFFNNDEIEEIVFEGYKSEVDDEFKKQIIQQVESDGSKIKIVTIDEEHSVQYYRDNEQDK